MKSLKGTLLSLLSLVFVAPVFAARVDDGGDGSISGGANPPKISAAGAILDKVIDIVFPMAGVICVIFIIIGGYMWIASAGDPSKVKQAQSTLTWAIIGLVFVLIAVLVVKTIVGAL
jgi:hypothetical protein